MYEYPGLWLDRISDIRLIQIMPGQNIRFQNFLRIVSGGTLNFSLMYVGQKLESIHFYANIWTRKQNA